MRLLLGLILFTMLGAGNVYAETVAVSVNVANIRSSPSLVISTVLLQVPRYYPLSTQAEQDGFYKVTDYLDNTGWIKKTSVDNTRAVINKAEKVNIRKGPGKKNQIVFKAQAGVAFKVLGEKGDWLKVEHESGVTGWIFRKLVWGN